MKDSMNQTAGQPILQFAVFRNRGVHAILNRQRARRDRIRRNRAEEFWAGRNHAMRRSARVAA